MADVNEPTTDAAAGGAGVEQEEDSAAGGAGVEQEEDSAAGGAGVEDEDTGAQVAPIVQLQQVAVTTGEEDEVALIDLKAKLYRFDKEGNQWKERGVGNVKLLKHKETGKVRLVMRQSKTLKICANHFVLPSISLQEHAGNDKSCVWHASDFADGELKDETFCIRFASVENCQAFKQQVASVAESQAKKDDETKEATAAASLIEKLSVEEKSEEEKPEAKEASATDEKDGNEKQEDSADK